MFSTSTITKQGFEKKTQQCFSRSTVTSKGFVKKSSPAFLLEEKTIQASVIASQQWFAQAFHIMQEKIMLLPSLLSETADGFSLQL